MQDVGDQGIDQALQIANEAVQFVRVAQNSADPQVIQQAERKLEQAKSHLEAMMKEEELETDEVSQSLAKLEQSRNNLTLSSSISDPVGYEVY
ncbi:hypothetical protein SAMN05444487_10675 [Marininema mesophilum]|uniref:Uncharacterized protein n=1 Tax=Marininema mesophilum TaxID=1048340 RepID=A0A1H2WBI0_9BACL|nr:hypothetical protein [Marininema mesophilum]SDW77878.1 hypothetical protein SAMN05444487_10675 [Marininema mesophilum]